MRHYSDNCISSGNRCKFDLKIAIIVNNLKSSDMHLPVTITDNALKEIKKIRATKQIPEDYGLRIGIKGGGCAGISYLLGFDKPDNDDGTFVLEGLPVHISKKHTMHVIGLILDFYQGSDAKGFMFSRPESND